MKLVLTIFEHSTQHIFLSQSDQLLNMYILEVFLKVKMPICLSFAFNFALRQFLIKRSTEVKYENFIQFYFEMIYWLRRFVPFTYNPTMRSETRKWSWNLLKTIKIKYLPLGYRRSVVKIDINLCIIVTFQVQILKFSNFKRYSIDTRIEIF